MKNALIVLVVLVVGFGVIFAASWLGATNREVSLRNKFEAKAKANEASFDTMWKIIQQKGGVADKYRDTFTQVFKEIVSGRATGSSALGKFVSEANPNFDTSLLKSLSASIEGERHRFLRDQEILVDIKREHDDVRSRFPSRLFVGGVKPLELQLVTSEKTADVFRTGREEIEK